MTPGVIDMCIRKGSADGWDCLGPGTTPAIFFKEITKSYIINL